MVQPTCLRHLGGCAIDFASDIRSSGATAAGSDQPPRARLAMLPATLLLLAEALVNLKKLKRLSHPVTRSLDLWLPPRKQENYIYINIFTQLLKKHVPQEGHAPCFSWKSNTRPIRTRKKHMELRLPMPTPQQPAARSAKSTTNPWDIP